MSEDTVALIIKASYRCGLTGIGMRDLLIGLILAIEKINNPVDSSK